MLGKLYRIAGSAPILLAASIAVACTVEDIKVIRAEVIVQSGTTYIAGRIANACGAEMGAQVRVTLRDDAGDPVFAGEFWPAGGRNIAPSASYGFTYVLSPVEPDPRHRPSRIAVEPIGVRQW